ncbi:hypothetical protein TNCV_2164551 [Trichonephila clavipes]|nr:hypothetical protein TNCV_2164551 [Trichonephila clavipes]
MCARVRKTYANSFPFLADKRSSSKIATSKQKAFCVIQFGKTESAVTVKRAFLIKIGCQPPNDNNILSIISLKKLAAFVKGSKGRPKL